MALVTVTVDTTFDVPLHPVAPAVNRLYVTVPPAVAVALPSVAESETEPPTVTDAADSVVVKVGCVLFTMMIAEALLPL